MGRRKIYQDSYHKRQRMAERAARKTMPARIEEIVKRDLQSERIPQSWDNFLNEKRRVKGKRVG